MNEKPKLIVIAGPNGSGKTSVTSLILEHEWIEGCTYVNPDIIALHDFGDWNSQEAVINAANKAKDIRENCLLNKKGILFETVLSSTEKIEYIERAKKAGYFIRLFFVSTDHPSINASRVARRVMEGGHDVPISKIISRYSKSIANCAEISHLVDRFYAYDNSEEFANPKLLFRAKNGNLQKQYTEINLWAQPIFNSLK